MRVEEVADRRHNFITDQGIEMSKLDIQCLGSHFTVELWHGQAVVAIGIPFSIKPTSDSVKKVSAVEQIDSATEAQLIFLKNPLIDEVELVHLSLPGTIIKGDRTIPICSPRIGANTNVNETVGFNPSVQ